MEHPVQGLVYAGQPIMVFVHRELVQFLEPDQRRIDLFMTGTGRRLGHELSAAPC